MASAKNALEWAVNGGLHGLGDSLYTPFTGRDGEEIDWDAYRWLVRYVAGDLKRDMLWTTSGVGEWPTLTMDERKKLLEITVEEGRKVNPNLVIEANTQALSMKDALELTQHAQATGADICFFQVPPLEAFGYEGVKAMFQYIADRTDIALGIFNSPSSNLVLTGKEMADLHHAIPAIVAVKEGVNDSISRTLALHKLAPKMQVWECDTIGAEAGWARDGIVPKAIYGNIGYLIETPEMPRVQNYYKLLWSDRIQEAIQYKQESGMAEIGSIGGYWNNNHPSRPGYMVHWGGASKYMAQVIGLPVGTVLSRPPQLPPSEEIKKEIYDVLKKHGMVGAVKANL